MKDIPMYSAHFLSILNEVLVGYRDSLRNLYKGLSFYPIILAYIHVSYCWPPGYFLEFQCKFPIFLCSKFSIFRISPKTVVNKYTWRVCHALACCICTQHSNLLWFSDVSELTSGPGEGGMAGGGGTRQGGSSLGAGQQDSIISSKWAHDDDIKRMIMLVCMYFVPWPDHSYCWNVSTCVSTVGLGMTVNKLTLQDRLHSLL